MILCAPFFRLFPLIFDLRSDCDAECCCGTRYENSLHNRVLFFLDATPFFAYPYGCHFQVLIRVNITLVAYNDIFWSSSPGAKCCLATNHQQAGNNAVWSSVEDDKAPSGDEVMFRFLPASDGHCTVTQSTISVCLVVGDKQPEECRADKFSAHLC